MCHLLYLLHHHPLYILFIFVSLCVVVLSCSVCAHFSIIIIIIIFFSCTQVELHSRSHTVSQPTQSSYTETGTLHGKLVQRPIRGQGSDCQRDTKVCSLSQQLFVLRLGFRCALETECTFKNFTSLLSRAQRGCQPRLRPITARLPAQNNMERNDFVLALLNTTAVDLSMKGRQIGDTYITGPCYGVLTHVSTVHLHCNI